MRRGCCIGHRSDREAAVDTHHHFEVDGMQVRRLEDARLVTGRGRYASDWNVEGQRYACFLRSDRAHARIVRIDASRARAQRGVHAVYLGEDAVAAGFVRPPHLLTFPGIGGMKARAPERPALAAETVRYVGEPVAMVVAETPALAQDAAETIDVEYEDLPVVVHPEDALAPGAPQLHESVPGNLAFEAETGDRAAVEAAFARAAHVVRLKVDCTRVTPSPMEPRACLVTWDPADESYTVRVCNQGISTIRQQIAAYSGVPEEKVKIVARDVGGGFGQRSPVYPEYVMGMLAARRLGRPVKWVSTRSEGFLTDTHGRANIGDGELALDRDGRFLAIRYDWITDQGGYISSGGPGYIRNIVNCLVGVYAIPAAYARFRVALTNTGLVGSYRGAGRPDIAYAIERLVDEAARATGIDRIELRRRNFIPSDAFPYRTPTGTTYENADFHGLLGRALAAADWSGFEQRRAASVKAGRLRGIGLSTVIEASGTGSFPKDEILLEVDGEGVVTVYTASQSQGQSHETTLAMIVAQALGIATERVRVRQTVAEKNITGNHTGGSRTMVGAGSVCRTASDKLVALGRSAAAEVLAVEPSQVDCASGEFIARDGGRRVTFAELARQKTLSVLDEGTYGSTWPNGCHVAEVEIDPQTGVTTIANYVAVDDCGEVINHMVVEGQVQGAVVQGAGQVFGEHIVYDRATGQLLTGSFMDYCMPRAGLVREVHMDEHPTPSKLSPLGVKGVGEAGCTGSLGALANAVHDALRPLGVGPIDMPLTPSKLWSAIAAVRARAA